MTATPLITQPVFLALASRPPAVCRIFALAVFSVSRPAYLVLVQHQPPAVGYVSVFLIAVKSFMPNNATLQRHNLIWSCSLQFYSLSGLALSQERTHEEQVRQFAEVIKMPPTPTPQSLLPGLFCCRTPA